MNSKYYFGIKMWLYLHYKTILARILSVFYDPKQSLSEKRTTCIFMPNSDKPENMPCSSMLSIAPCGRELKQTPWPRGNMEQIQFAT